MCRQYGVLVRTSTLVHTLSWPVHMKFICTKDQRYTLVFAATGGFESHNNVPIRTTVPRGTE